jgi:hypothetical protein
VETLVGIFNSRQAAEHAVSGLRTIGLRENAITFVTPEHSERELASVPTTEAESPGIGEVISGYVGGAIGGSLGLGVGSALASLFVPGVGIVVAAGLGAAAIVGVAGAAVGAAVGDATEKALDQGVPRDDVLFYRELLKQRRSIVVASADTEEIASAIRAVFRTCGTENVEMARQQWEAARSDQAA